MRQTNVVSDQILNSWKEIAQYLNRGVRTVQRWESELGLPVRRPRGRRRSAVIAMRAEIDEWLNACPLEAREQIAMSAEPLERNGVPVPVMGDERRPLSALILDSRNLREDLERSRKSLEAVLRELMSSIQFYQKLIEREDPEKTAAMVETLETLEEAREQTRVA